MLAPIRRLLTAVCVISPALALTACVENSGELVASAPSQNSARNSRPAGNPGGATVTFSTIEGAPSQVIALFSDKTVAEAARRQISVAEGANAHYLVRGYLSAYAVEGGTAFGYVWDVFNKRRQRVQRTEDSIVVRGSAGDPWSLANEQALASLAAKSADDLAAILSTMPEANSAVAAGIPEAGSGQPTALIASR